MISPPPPVPAKAMMEVANTPNIGTYTTRTSSAWEKAKYNPPSPGEPQNELQHTTAKASPNAKQPNVADFQMSRIVW